MFKEVEEALRESGFSYCEYDGCFDIAARKGSMLLIKLLTNIDSLQENQADSLKVISHSLEAKSILIGLHTRRERLDDNVLYERFDIPAVNPSTFENIVVNNALPMIYQFRGGRFVEIEPEKLRSAREQKGMSQSDLAARVGITKKSVYEHESRRMKMEYGSAMKIEKALKTELILPLEIENKHADIHLAPKTVFETKISRTFHNMGFETSSVYHSPFNVIAQEKDMMLLSNVEEKPKAKNISAIKNFAKVSKKSAVIVTKEEANFDVPSVTEKQLAGLDKKGIRKLVKRW
ncbi:MAG TPA: helix-turn-helix domain-containing protein [archaeon]|nr:helix-turn-helix domain-containing protein [archaeon]